MRLGDAQVGKEPGDEPRAHRAAAVGAYDELAGQDALALAGLRLSWHAPTNRLVA
jgi:hypothetical protein